MVQRNVIVELNRKVKNGSILVYYCNESSSDTDAIISICTEEGKWIPDPTEYTCEQSNGMQKYDQHAGPRVVDINERGN